ncbi:hydrolase [Acidocella aquatica]|uniref:Hydrolase n=1 Tax=Acidocella aquatica TaxID=1922313 RepID=A0ABQ6A2B9_9PROT|nr:dienelactone hydrolase family protein [Acidocella aquatica]GLR65548.1 hydrolase [Acidocella aquatica]
MKTVRILSVALAAAAVLFCGLSGPAQAQEQVGFQASDPFTANEVTLTAELNKPLGNGPFPAVVVMHGCGGWQPAVLYSLDLLSEYLSEHGYVVLDVDSFGPRNLSGDEMCASNAQLRQALVYRAHDAFDAMRYLRAQPFVQPQDIFLMGQSNGGSVALEAADASDLKSLNGPGAFRGVVAYYPWCGVYSQRPVDLASPLLIFNGGADNWVSASQCTRIKSTGADIAEITYPDAVHSFDINIPKQLYQGHWVGYDPQAAQDSEARMLAFFNAQLTPDIRQD